MSQFDEMQTALSGAVFDFYGDAAIIHGGPLNRDTPDVATIAILDVQTVRDEDGGARSGNVLYEVTFIEYLREHWPHPRRGDTITMRGETWMVTEKRDATGDTQIVEVTYNA